VWKRKGKDPPGRSRRTWEDNIKMIFEMCSEYELHWSSTGEGQGAGCCKYGNDLRCFIKCGGFLEKPRNSWLVKEACTSCTK